MEKYCPVCFQKYPANLTRCPKDNKKLVSLTEQDLVGRELDERYKVLSLLGKGGMGVVYVAEQAMIGRRVALKVLRRDVVTDESSVKRFMIEAKAIANLVSPHTITLHDFGITEEGLLYYTMELLKGLALNDMVKRGGPLDFKVAADFILQTLESLEEAHEHEILHRDLKPENLFITERRGKKHLTVLDFGIAKLVGDTSIETVTRTGMICGTPAYLSPEQALGNPAVPASDLYSLAIVFYELLSGSPPFVETTPMKILLKHLNERPEPVHVRNPNVVVPSSIDAFLQKSLEKRPTDRFPDVKSFRQALQAALDVHLHHPETVNLSSLTTTSDGVRQITQDMADLDGHSDTIMAPAYDLSADTSTGDNEVLVDPGGARTAKEVPSSDAIESKAEQITVRKLDSPRRSRLFLWLGLVLAIVILAGILLVWQPWAQPRTVDTAPARPASVVTDRPDVVEVSRIDVAPVLNDIVEVSSLDIAAVSVDVVEVSRPDVAAVPVDVVEVSRPDVAPVPVDVVESSSPDVAVVPADVVTKAPEVKIKKDVTIPKRTIRKKKYKPVVKKKVEDKRKEEKPAFGFRAVNVDDKKDKKKESDKKDSGFGFRPVNVDDGN